MKNFALAMLASLASQAAAQNLFEQIVGGSSQETLDTGLSTAQGKVLLNHQVAKNNFGCLVEESLYEGAHVEKTIKAPLVPFHLDYTQQE